MEVIRTSPPLAPIREAEPSRSAVLLRGFLAALTIAVMVPVAMHLLK
jgi:hypothetical protein